MAFLFVFRHDAHKVHLQSGALETSPIKGYPSMAGILERTMQNMPEKGKSESSASLSFQV
jgi:hypothetical protein